MIDDELRPRAITQPFKTERAFLSSADIRCFKVLAAPAAASRGQSTGGVNERRFADDVKLPKPHQQGGAAHAAREHPGQIVKNHRLKHTRLFFYGPRAFRLPWTATDVCGAYTTFGIPGPRLRPKLDENVAN